MGANTTINSPKEKTIDFSSILREYAKYWWLFIASFVVCGALAGFYLKIKSPTYLVASSILIGDDDAAMSGGAGASKGQGSSIMKSLIGGGNANVDNELVIMGSESLNAQMISVLDINRSYYQKTGFLQKKDLYRTSPVTVDAPEQIFDTLSVTLKFKIEINKSGKANISVKKGMFNTIVEMKDVQLPTAVKTPYGIFTVNKTRYYVPGKELTINAVLSGNIAKSEALSEDMTIKVMSKKADAIYLDVLDTDVKRGRDILNTLMALYNERGLKDKDNQAINTAKFIDERINLIYKNLMGTEAEIESYKKAHKMVDPEIQVKSIIGKQDITQSKLIGMETQYRIVKMIKDFIANPTNKHTIVPFEADSTAASSAIKTYNKLLTDRMRLSGSAKDNNQSLKILDEQIDVMRNTVKKSIDNTLAAIRIQMSQVGSVNAEATDKVNELPTTEREAKNLYREQEIQNELYIFLLQKREENALRLASTTPKGKVVDPAYAMSKPITPKLSIVLMLTLLGGFFIPIIIIQLKKALNTKFNTQDELEAIANSPVIGHIHHNRHNTPLVVKSGKTSSIVELFRYVRNNVQFMLNGKNDKVVLVTSGVSGEGKSFISTNVASSFALLGKKVALVGMDIRSPKLADMLNLKSVPGVTSYLADPEQTIDSVVQHISEVDGLDVLVGGAIPPNPSELLLSNRTAQFIDELRSRYDVIIIDSAPVGMVSDTFSLAKFADATLFVTRANYTKRNMVKFLNKLVETNRLPNVGLIINDTKPSSDNTYGYGYGQTNDNED